jgi:hypothetical protein
MSWPYLTQIRAIATSRRTKTAAKTEMTTIDAVDSFSFVRVPESQKKIHIETGKTLEGYS